MSLEALEYRCTLEDTSCLYETDSIRLLFKTCIQKSFYSFLSEINVYIEVNKKLRQIGQIKKFTSKNICKLNNDTFFCDIPLLDLLSHEPDVPLHFQIKKKHSTDCCELLPDIPNCLKDILIEYRNCCNVRALCISNSTIQLAQG